ncbi:glutamine amidotransferase [Shinella sp. CPCC 100929]|uniref:Glutamine amidotransferase n=1 Tax=Shinella lacus TaxID=2654216 RepID=A0ABT1R1Q2_9HYPH|nr:glutamine amidotransferase [Shinella lacus]MCQ4629107.1 glutamine amidotransferase [Shinella lacus]
MTKTKVLLVGESWVSSATHYKGFDQFGSVTFHLGAEPLVAALKDSDFDLHYMTAHEAVEKLPFTLEGLSEYAVIILSDIGANSLLLHPDVWLHGKTIPNRLKLLRDWAAAGGGLIMIGGYFSFQGIDGKARWHRTAVEDALPVTCLPYDDRLEIPEGFRPVINADHAIFAGIEGEWPVLLGANEVVARKRDDVEVLASLPDDQGGHPLLVTGAYGKGRTVAWTSDIGPHWLPNTFVEWPGYARLWKNVLGWAARQAL